MKIRSRRSAAWVYILVGALVVFATMLILGVWFFYRLNTVEEIVETLTPEALKDRWRAITMLSERYGVTVHTESALIAENMPELSDIVILEDVRSTIVVKSTSDALAHWVRQGGTLIYRVPVLNPQEDPLDVANSEFFPFNLLVYDIQEHNREFEYFSQLLRFEKQDCRRVTSPIRFSFDDTAQHDGIPWRDIQYNQSPLNNSLNPISVDHFFHTNYGQGQIYLASDLELWTNQRVDCADNAYVFMRMIHGSTDLVLGDVNHTAVWIVPRNYDNTPSIFALTWNNYYVSIIGFLLTFLVALIARNMRSSPAIHAIPIPRRATIDYVTSVSEFAWRNNSIEQFFQAFLRVSNNPTGIFGPGQAKVTTQSPSHSNHLSQINTRPTNEEDLVRNVRLLQAELRKNIQPSLRNS